MSSLSHLPLMDEQEFRVLFATIPELRYRFGVPGAECSTWRIGGPISCLVEVQSLSALEMLLREVQIQKLPHRFLGAGSNLLIADAGVPELVIQLGPAFRTLEFQESARVQVGAAFGLMSLSRKTAAQGLSGLEFAGGIPATVGGAVRMNAGTHGGEIASCL